MQMYLDPVAVALAQHQAQQERDQRDDDVATRLLMWLAVVLVLAVFVIWLASRGAFNPAGWGMEGN